MSGPSEVKPKKVGYVRLGNSGLKVSKLILGTMQYGSKQWQGWIMEEDETVAHIKAAYEMGIQTFDTANVYSNGESEVVLGKAIKKLGLPREEIVVMTKLCKVVPKDGPGSWFLTTNKDPEEYGYVNQFGLSRKAIFEGVKASLARLQMDYVDVLQCHQYDKETPMEETMQALHDIVQAGYARYIGMGPCYAWQFHQMQNYAITHNLTPFISIQNQYSLLYREDERELFPTLKIFGSGCMPWSPLARGLLAKPLSQPTTRAETDRFLKYYKVGPWKHDQEVIKRVEEIAKKKGISMSQVALASVLANPTVTAPIVGCTTIAQLEDLVGALDVKLEEDELKYLKDAYRPRTEAFVWMTNNF